MNPPKLHLLLAVELKTRLCGEGDHMMLLFVPRGVEGETDPDDPDFTVARLTPAHPALTVVNVPEDPRVRLDIEPTALCMN